jgi:hypothetical protein
MKTIYSNTNIHLEKFLKVVQENGIVLSKSKMEMYKEDMDILGLYIKNGKVQPQPYME